jgi:hypothetical protein
MLPTPELGGRSSLPENYGRVLQTEMAVNRRSRGKWLRVALNP